MPRKTFTTTADANAEPVEFDIQGTMKGGGRLDPVTFRCLDDVPGRYLTDSVAKLAEGRELAVGEITGFIERVLIDDAERERFINLTTSPEVLIKGDLLAEIMRWLMEEYGNRPLATSPSWSTGDSPTPTISKDVGQPPASTPWGNRQSSS